MDAHLFRRICEFLLPALIGTRIEKIHQISDGLIAFTIYGLGKFSTFNQDSINNGSELTMLPDKKTVLILKLGKKPLLFFSDYRPQTNQHPPANIMRLRKYLAGKRIIKAYADWTLRKIFLEVSGNNYFCIDLRSGIDILFECPKELEELNQGENFCLAPQISTQSFTNFWPDFDKVYAQCVEKQEDIWQEFPTITPLLRKVFPYLDKLEGSALYADLQFGGGDIVIYEQADKKNKSEEELLEILPFFLPEQLENKLGYANAKKLQFEHPYSALLHLGEIFFTAHNKKNQTEALKEAGSKVKKLDKLLEKLTKEEDRLNKMLAKKQDALILQANLYQLDTNKKEKNITLLDTAGQECLITLDPTKTIRENMEHFFHESGRGKRGLFHLTGRRAQIAEQKNALLQEALQNQNLPTQSISKKVEKHQVQKADKKVKFNKGSHFKAEDKIEVKTDKKSKFPTQVQVFISSDGFTILRGRDTKGNALALKMANPFDYWVHTADGPSAHVIVRKNHPNQEIPEATMQEAGILAVLKSAQKDQAKALVQYSFVKYIRSMKNAGAGLVHIDKIEGTYSVEVIKNIEEKLT